MVPTNGPAKVENSPPMERLINMVLQPGTINLLEIGPNIPIDIPYFFILRIALEQMRKKRGVLWFPGTHLPMKDIVRILSYSYDQADIPKYNKFLTTAMTSGMDHLTQEIPLASHSIGGYLAWDLNMDILPEAKSPTIMIIEYDHLQSITDVEIINNLKEFFQETPDSENIVLGLAKWSLNEVKQLADISSTHLRFLQTGRNVLMFGEKPHTHFYNVDVVNRDEIIDFDLIPIF